MVYANCCGFGDTACNIVAGAMKILTFFYTDYAGVEPTTVGLVMLLSCCFDGVSDFTQFVYLFITYNFCNTVCYTVLNLPYGSLSAR